MKRQRRLHLTWLLCAAMLLMALMPTLSRAFASQRGASTLLMEICSVGGLKKLVSLSLSDGTASSASSESPDQQLATMMDNCPYCRVQADLPVLPPAPTASIIAKLATERPLLFYRAPVPLFSWAAAHPRGPPLA